MSGLRPYYNWLTEGEEIIRGLQTKTIDIIATNRRLVILMGGNIHETFDYKYIAHMFLESKSSSAWLLTIGIGIIFTILGIFLGEDLWQHFWSFRVYFFARAREK